MTKEELEKRVHDFAELIYKQGYEDGLNQANEPNKRYTILDVEKARNEGVEDTWDCARKLMLSCGEGGYDAGTIADIFGMSYQDVLKECKPNKVIKLFKEYEALQKQNERKVDCEVTACYNCINHNYCDYEYEEKQTDATDINDGSIKVGDEIYSDDTDMTAVVHHIDAWGRYQCFNENGAQFVLDKETYDEYWHKTYKYYAQIAEVLEQLKNG
jgi:hypothetical protein